MGSFSLRQVLAVARSLGIRCVVQRSLYGFRQRRYERDEPALTSCPEDEPLGEVAAQTQGGQALELECDGGILRVELMAIDLFRLRLRRSGEALDPVFSYALDPGAEWPAVPFEMEEDGAGWTVRTQQIACQVTRSPCRVSFFTASGLPLSEAGDGMGHRGLGAFCTRSLAEGEMVFGLAEKALDLNLRGRALEMWNRDPEGYSPGDDPINLNIPFLLGLRQGRAYGLFFDNPGRCRFDLGHAQHDRLRYEADTGELCLYFFGGPTPAAVVERYCQLTGRMPLPPRWMLGYHQSRWSYYPEREVREVVGEFRRRRIPCDAIHLDIHHLDGYRVFTWDAGRFSDPGN